MSAPSTTATIRLTFLNGIPADRVVQFHMAGHSHMGTHIIDTHDHPVCEDVWDLYVAALKRFGRVSTMIERDDNIPPLDELLAGSEPHPRDRRESLAASGQASGMSDFARQQADFQRGILTGDDTVLAEILDSPKEKRETLFGVYRYAYGSRLVEAMRNDHELLHAYLGDEMFDEMGHAYVKARPSRTSEPALVLARPAGIPAIATSPTAIIPCWRDLAALEKALNDAFDAAEGAVLELTDMAGVCAGERGPISNFQPHPSACGSISRPTRPRSGWRSRTTRRRRMRPTLEEPVAPAGLAAGHDADVPRTSAEEAMMWDEAANGVPFGVLCEMLATYDDPDSAAARGAGYLHGWITSGILTGVSA